MGANNKIAKDLDVLTKQENHYILDIYLYVKNRLTNDNLV